MAEYYWEVKVPETGDLTREQAWGLLGQIHSKLDHAMRRIRGLVDEEDKSPLSKDERDSLFSVVRRLRVLADGVKKGVLDRLADLDEDDNDGLSFSQKNSRFPKAIRHLIGWFYGDIYQYESKGGDTLTLAFALLEENGLGPSDITKIIEDNFEPDRRGSDCYRCPQCDDYNLGKVGKDLCKRCLGWGYVFGDEPDISEYDWSEKGRAALNNGEVWTSEMEEAEQERLRAEDELDAA